MAVLWPKIYGYITVVSVCAAVKDAGQVLLIGHLYRFEPLGATHQAGILVL